MDDLIAPSRATLSALSLKGLVASGTGTEAIARASQFALDHHMSVLLQAACERSELAEGDATVPLRVLDECVRTAALNSR